MGHSEINCTLCGVSFNICRIRTPNEPREYAWMYSGHDKPGTSFIAVGDCCDVEDDFTEEVCVSADFDYPGQEGCMVAFREDQAVRLRGMSGLLRRGRNDKTWDELVFEGLEGERVDLGEDLDDKDWVPEEESGSADDESQVEEFHFELGSVSGDYSDDFEMEGEKSHEVEEGSAIKACGQGAKIGSESGSDDRSEYFAWLGKVMASAHLYVYGYPSDSRDMEKIKWFEKLRCLAEEFHVKVPVEVKLPLYVPLESTEEPLRSEIEQGQHEMYTNGWNDKMTVSPILNHPLTALGLRDGCWEHLAGPDCRSTKGYHGSRISVEEMLNCNVAQAILPGSLDTSWELDSTCEVWEGKGKSGWFLTGLVDHMETRDTARHEPYPIRHSEAFQNGFIMDCIQFDSADDRIRAMSFHPTCLEVFVRASLKRNGCFDVNSLGNWWRSAANYSYISSIPRAEDVNRGNTEESWTHHTGAEYLAADPCFVPSLRKILRSSQRAETTNTRSRASIPPLLILPVEIQRSIVSYLSLLDVASLCIACPDPCTLDLIRSRLLDEMPYLWELWCSVPYSRWTGTNAAKIRAGIDAFDEQEREIARVLDVLDEEGYRDERACLKQYWDHTREERRKESRSSLQEKPTDFIDIQKLDLARLVLRLDKAQTEGDLKGLKNRERIWTDCNMILDLIEELQDEGKIPPPSQVYPRNVPARGASDSR